MVDLRGNFGAAGRRIARGKSGTNACRPEAVRPPSELVNREEEVKDVKCLSPYLLRMLSLARWRRQRQPLLRRFENYFRMAQPWLFES